MQDDLINFDQFKNIYNLIRKLLEATHELFTLNDDMKRLPGKIEVEIMRTHNAACDLLLAMKEEKIRKGE